MDAPLIVSEEEYSNAIDQACKDIGCPQYPSMPSSSRVFVFHKQFILDEWAAYWNSYKFSRNLTYFNPGMCEHFARACQVELNWAVLLRAHNENLGDLTSGLIEVRVTNPNGTNLNNIRDGGHGTCLVAVTEDGKTFSFLIWEPQNELWTKFEDAIARGVIVNDALI